MILETTRGTRDREHILESMPHHDGKGRVLKTHTQSYEKDHRYDVYFHLGDVKILTFMKFYIFI